MRLLEQQPNQIVPKKAKDTHENAVPVASGPKKRSPRKQPAAVKSSAKKTSVKTNQRKSVPVLSVEATDEEIRMRAYFISERRRRLGLAGDSNSDWLEAKRQLLSEAGPR